MDSVTVDNARAAYKSGDFSTAAALFAQATDEGEVAGEVEHLRGNSLMHLRRYAEAAEAYGKALDDASYGKRGALLTNQGKALAATGDFSAAAEAFEAATQDNSYATPYKAFMGLGKSYLELDRVAEAGTAFRQAAIDGANPAPAGALSKLGDCFIKLGRPQDAVESYRTALDFATARDDVRAIHAGMGEALAATGRAQDAVESFNQATADGIYQLSAEQQNAFDQASAQVASARGNILSTAPQGIGTTGIDPLDPLGKSGQFMPDPSDTGFFTMTENEMVQQSRAEAKVRRKHRHTGLKVFLVILILLLLVCGGGAFAYTQGYGFPTQEQAVEGLFQAVTDGDTAKAEEYLSSNLSDESKQLIIAAVPSDATPSIEALDKSMTESTARVVVELSKGGTATYEARFERSSNKIGWAVSSLDITFNSSSTTDSDDSDDSTDTEVASTDDGSADDGVIDSSDNTMNDGVESTDNTMNDGVESTDNTMNDGVDTTADTTTDTATE